MSGPARESDMDHAAEAVASEYGGGGGGAGQVPAEPRDWVPAAELRAWVDEVARKFNPEKIILFGSRARGDNTPDSDADILVVMAFEGRGRDQAVRIRGAAPRRFPLDLLVRRPEDLRKRIEWGDPFLKEIVEKGQVLYERAG